MDLQLRQSFFAAVRSDDVAAVRGIIDGEGAEEAAGLMKATTEAGETALYIAAENNQEELFRYLVGFCDEETANIRSKKDMDAFQVAAKEGHAGELLYLFSSLKFSSRLS